LGVLETKLVTHRSCVNSPANDQKNIGKIRTERNATGSVVHL
jgi:hypothetical protein